MEIIFASSFGRGYRKLEEWQKERVDRAIAIFREDPFDQRLKNHKLRGQKEGVRSISGGYDLRILYFEHDGHAVVILVEVGTHDEVY